VVIVILGILAAIAVPALTGYIAKSQDQEYIMEARNHLVTARAVIDEAYAEGDFQSAQAQTYLTDSTTYPLTSTNYHSFVGGAWSIENLSKVSIYDDVDVLPNEIAFLMGQEDRPARTAQGFWSMWIIGSTDSTALSCDGGIWEFFPEGINSGKPAIKVTYKMDRLSIPDGSTTTAFSNAIKNDPGTYNPNAGYEVYHLVI
jgi:type II secretory pathway pseudopilin PulG